jgi:hypothetical protein
LEKSRKEERERKEGKSRREENSKSKLKRCEFKAQALT